MFVLSREGDRFAAIEDSAAVTGLPVARASRALDPAILRPEGRAWMNGHVPVTGIVSAVAVLAAVLRGHDAVVMSNEWSASIGNLEAADGRSINHQWSKSWAFEELLRAHLDRSFTVAPDYFSWLRPWSELWVARRFADLDGYHRVFRSCNRAFALDPARRLDHWCGRCEKCCFIDLVLAPFVPAARLAEVWGGREPLADPSLAPVFRALIGRSEDHKPWECVGEVGECRAAVALSAARADRAGTGLLAELAAEIGRAGEAGCAGGPAGSGIDRTGVGGPAGISGLFGPLGPSAVPERYAPSDLLG